MYRKYTFEMLNYQTKFNMIISTPLHIKIKVTTCIFLNHL